MAFEMEELHRRRRSRVGPRRATVWFAAAVADFAVRLGAEALARWARDAAADLRYGARVLRGRPEYLATAVLTLGLGVGGLTAVYAVADFVLLGTVPGVADRADLVTLRMGSTESPRPSWPVSQQDLAALTRGIGAVSSLAARTPLDVNLAFEEGAPALRVRAAAVSPGWFETLGVPMAAGRAPSPAPDPGRAGSGEVVIAWSLAASLAARPADALGRRILVDGVPHRVVGVTGREFRGAELPGETRAWLGPAALSDLVPGAPADLFRQGTRGVWSLMVGRLADGASASTVQAQANRVMEETRRAGRPNTFSATHFVFQAFPGVGLDPALQRPVRRTVALLSGGAAFLLLLATLNVANLALTHAATRRAATRVRRALGASPGRLVRQVLAEHALLGAAGAAVGLAVALGGVRLFRQVRLEEFGAALTGLGLDPAVVAAALALSLVTALAAGSGAALVAGVGRPPGGLRERSGGSPLGRRARFLLAAAQMALSTVLVVGAGLMARTVANLRSLDLGFDPAGILAFSIDPADAVGDGTGALPLLERLTAELEAEPEIAAAGFVSPEPLRTSYLTSWLGATVEADGEGEGVVGAHLQVAGHFLEAMGIRVLAGRTFDENERTRSAGRLAPTVLLTRAGARRIFPDRSLDEVVGDRAYRPRRSEPPLRIAGVIDDLRLTGPREDPPPVFVVPWAQGHRGEETVGWVRARSGAAGALGAAVRRAVRRAEPGLPVYDLRTVREQADRMAARERVLAGLVGAVSVLGLVLAAAGLYGVLGYAVAERRREIGVRTALGADPGRLLGRILGGGLGLAGAGLVVGLAGAAVLTRVLRSRLYGVEPLDPLTYGLGGVLLLAVALVASWLPARRATRVPVVEVFREEG
ncbi:MAG TPA: ABC transporter permease [Longimicrobiales bacterium]|nr:ABC transporter permease [Longimicrobiales bacterium]